MSRFQKFQVFATQRLNAALEEILAVFEKIIDKYEQEAALSREVISRQHALLCALHTPAMDVPSADYFTQQLVSKQPVDVLDQDQQTSEVKDKQEEIQGVDLDLAEIIQFTYKVRPGEVVVRSQSEPGPAHPDLVVQLESSETEDSDDYGTQSAEFRSYPQTRSDLKPPGTETRLDPNPPGPDNKSDLNPQRPETRSDQNPVRREIRRRHGLLRCRVCSQTFKNQTRTRSREGSYQNQNCCDGCRKKITRFDCRNQRKGRPKRSRLSSDPQTSL